MIGCYISYIINDPDIFIIILENKIRKIQFNKINKLEDYFINFFTRHISYIKWEKILNLLFFIIM